MSDVTSVFFLQKPGLGVEQRELHLVADCSAAQTKASCRSGECVAGVDLLSDKDLRFKHKHSV